MSELTLPELLKLKEELTHDPQPSDAPAGDCKRAGAHVSEVQTRRCEKHDMPYTVTTPERPAWLPQDVPWRSIGNCPECSREAEREMQATQAFHRFRETREYRKRLFEVSAQVNRELQPDREARVTALFNHHAAALMADCEAQVDGELRQEIEAEAERRIQDTVMQELRQQEGANG